MEDNMSKQIIVVDYDDNEIGVGEKIDIHKKGLLHRAFSVFLVNESKVLLQKRNISKYHSGGKIANSCCSHPYVGETTQIAAERRVAEELGITHIDLTEIGHIVYRCDFGTGITEYEYDHIFVGFYDGQVVPDKNEIEEAYWQEVDLIKIDVTNHPEKYTCWFISAFTVLLEYLRNEKRI